MWRGMGTRARAWRAHAELAARVARASIEHAAHSSRVEAVSRNIDRVKACDSGCATRKSPLKRGYRGLGWKASR